MPPADPPRPTSSAVVLACGLATLDVVQTVDHVPAPDEKIVAADLMVAAGGPAANAAVTCAALGVRARLLTRIGDGTLATAVHADLAAHGVEVLDVADAGAEPPVSTVLVTRASGERAVVSVNGTAGRGRPRPDVVVPGELWNDVAVVLVDGHHLDLAVRCAREARRRGVVVLLDGGSWKPGLEELLGLVDVAVLSADFAVPEGGPDVLEDVRRTGPAVVAQSRGAAPILVAAAGERSTVSVPAVDVVDTLGAGDVLHGALAARIATRGIGPAPAGAWAHRREALPTTGVAGWVEALGWAAQVASRSCASHGPRGWTTDAAIVAWRRDLAD